MRGVRNIIQFKERTEFEKYNRELLDGLPEVQSLEKGYRFGVAYVLSSLNDWTERLINNGTKNLKPEEIRTAITEWMNSDTEIKVLTERFSKDYNKMKY